jgi:hypothetical protein
MSDVIDMFDDTADEGKEQVCDDFNYFNLNYSDVTDYEEYNNIECDLRRFAFYFGEDHVSRCILHIVKQIWLLRGQDKDEDCMYILGEKYIQASVLTEHFSLNLPARLPLQFSNSYIEVSHTQSAWYIVYYWLRVVRLNFYNWYVEYVNMLYDANRLDSLRKFLARPTIHIILCMSNEALEFWNHTMCQSHNASDAVFNEYMMNIHCVLLSIYENILRPLLFTRSELHQKETQDAFVALFRSGSIQFYIDGNGRSAASRHWRRVAEIVNAVGDIDTQTSSIRKRKGGGCSIKSARLRF